MMNFCVDGVYISDATSRLCFDGVPVQSLCFDGVIVYQVVGGTAPNISCPGDQMPIVGTAVSYSPTNSGGAVTNWSMSGNPPELGINSSTGVISGTVSTLGNHLITVTGTNAFGSDSCSFNVNITASLAPPNLSTSPAMPDAVVGTPYTYTFVNTGGAPTSCTPSALPAGLTFDPGTYTISGTPTTAASAVTMSLTCVNGAGSSTFSDVIDITSGGSAGTASWSGPNPLELQHDQAPAGTQPCRITFGDDGSWFTQANQNLDPSGTYLTPPGAGNAGLFEIMWTEYAGGFGNQSITGGLGNQGVWQTISGPFVAQVVASVPNSFAAWGITFNIREIANPTNITTFNVLLQSSRF